MLLMFSEQNTSRLSVFMCSLLCKGSIMIFSNGNLARIYCSALVRIIPIYFLNAATSVLNYKVGTGNGQSFFNCSVQFSSVAQSCPTLCDTMNRSTPGLPVHHQLPEFTQTHVHQVHGVHVHRVSDAIQPSHPLSPSPPAPNPSQHWSFFQV